VFTVLFESNKQKEASMHKGDSVIADNPESRSNSLTRFYGIVLEITKTGSVLIELADGSVIKRGGNSVAAYIKVPLNWHDLYEQQEIPFSRPRPSLFPRRAKTPQ
jgi:hypothetical protein